MENRSRGGSGWQALWRRRSRSAGKGLLSRLAGACAGCTVAWMVVPSSATAQDKPWQFAVTPYLWAAGITGSMTHPSSRITFDRDFGDIFKDLSGLPIMFGAEVRKDRWGVAFDMVWLEITSEINTRNFLFNDGKARLSALQVSAVGLYRVIEEPAGKLDIGVGARLWSVSSKATLNAGLLPRVSDNVEKTFVDPLLAARFEFRLGQRWSLTVYGDVGGFGIGSDVTWQALGTLNYRAADWVDVRLGWRHMAVDRKKINLDLDGPILAATFRF